MATRDEHKDPSPRRDHEAATGHHRRAQHSAAQDGPAAGSGSTPAATAGDDREVTPTGAASPPGERDLASRDIVDERRDDYGAGVQPHHGKGDADEGAWPPGDWDENGNAARHGQSREGRGPGGYEDRSRELRDFGPGPKGSSGEAWRTYEHHADDKAGQGHPDADEGEDTDSKATSDRGPRPG